PRTPRGDHGADARRPRRPRRPHSGRERARARGDDPGRTAAHRRGRGPWVPGAGPRRRAPAGDRLLPRAGRGATTGGVGKSLTRFRDTVVRADPDEPDLLLREYSGSAPNRLRTFS